MATRLLLIAVSGWIAVAAQNIRAEDQPSPLELFEQRITPILKSSDPASCVQCHLSSVDLKDYIRPSHEATFVSLRDQGMIDLETPAQSKILALIQMGEKDNDAGARLIHETTRKAEYAAFSAWIEACCNDPELRTLPPADPGELAGPGVPDAVIRHARKSRVVDSFARNIWSQRMRCFPCHTPHELDPDNPKHRVPIQRQKKFLEQHGEQFGDRLTIFHRTPEETLQYLIERSLQPKEGELPLLNLQDPAKSLLVLKPTAKLPQKQPDGQFAAPSYNTPVSHMGGLKMHDDDPSYKSFIAWISDYAKVTRGEYTSVADLPADNWQPTKLVIMMRKVPPQWPDNARVQFFVHRHDQQSGRWNPDPVAFTQAPVGPAGNAAGALFLLDTGLNAGAATVEPVAQRVTLEPGKYLIKVFVDRQHRLADDPTLMLGEEDFAGQVVVDAEWQEGFPKALRLFGEMLEDVPDHLTLNDTASQ